MENVKQVLDNAIKLDDKLTKFLLSVDLDKMVKSEDEKESNKVYQMFNSIQQLRNQNIVSINQMHAYVFRTDLIEVKEDK